VDGEMLIERRSSILSFQARAFHGLAKFFVFRTVRHGSLSLEFVHALKVRLRGAIVLFDQASFLWTDCSYCWCFHVLMVDTTKPVFVSSPKIYL
jgi:hypothetical protein